MRSKNSCLVIAAWLGVLALVAAPTEGDAAENGGYCNSARLQEIDLRIERKKPLVLKGPSKLRLSPLNRLRYDIVIGEEVVTTPGPDLSVLGLIPALPSAVKTAAAKAAPLAETDPKSTAVRAAFEVETGEVRFDSLAEVADERQRDYERALRLFESQLESRDLQGLTEWAGRWRDPLGRVELRPAHLVAYVFARLQIEISSAEADLIGIRAAATATKTELEQARGRLDDLVRRSDQILRDSQTGAGPLLEQIRVVQPDLEGAVQTAWPRSDVGALATKLRQIEDELDKLEDLEGFSLWREECNPVRGLCNSRRYGAALDDVGALSEELAFFAPGSEAWKAQAELRAGLQTWLSRLRDLDVDSFEQVYPADCDYPFFESRTRNIQVVLTDRLEKDASKATRTIQAAEIACPSHFSVTAGVGVARVDERDIAFVSAPATSGGGLTKVFGFENRSDEQINPTFLVSTRLCQRPRWDAHISFGTVLDFDRPKESSAFGYLGGATISIKDQLFMTLGLQAQRVPELAGGFEIGQEVPADLTAPPMEKDWDFGPVLAVTYKVN